jgi:hypothetical protein
MSWFELARARATVLGIDKEIGAVLGKRKRADGEGERAWFEARLVELQQQMDVAVTELSQLECAQTGL